MTARTRVRAGTAEPGDPADRAGSSGVSAARVSPRTIVASTRSATAVHSPARSVKCR